MVTFSTTVVPPFVDTIKHELTQNHRSGDLKGFEPRACPEIARTHCPTDCEKPVKEGFLTEGM